jgi:putative transposase
MSTAHRKLLQHFHEHGHLHELTFSCVHRRPLLTNDAWRAELAAAIERSCHRHSFGLLAYVFMPEHVHLLEAPFKPEPNIPRFLADIKRPSSLSIKRNLISTGSGLLNQLTIQPRPGETAFHFRQAGPGYDRNLTEINTILSAIDYIHENPVRRGLCRRAVDWRWSSAGRLIGDAPSATCPTLHRLDPHSLMISPMTS